jgi:uncharacterized protein (TIGR01244 family)
MNIREITPSYSVSPQIEGADIAALAQSGFSRIICNRPDSEVPDSLQQDAIKIAAEAAGLAFTYLPLTHATMTPENVARQKALVDTADGPVLAYCASGTRSSVIWALAQVGSMPVDDILSAVHRAGYDLQGLRPTLTGLETT